MWRLLFVTLTGVLTGVGSAWPMMGFAPTHNHKASLARGLTPHSVKPMVKWKYNHNGGEVESSAMLSNDESTVFTAAGSDIVAVDTVSGKKRWSYKAQAQVLASGCAADGAFFIGADDKVFYAIEQDTGEKRWSYTTGGEFTAGATPVTVKATGEKLILVGTGGPIQGRDDGGTLIAFRPKDGNANPNPNSTISQVLVTTTPILQVL